MTSWSWCVLASLLGAGGAFAQDQSEPQILHEHFDAEVAHIPGQGVPQPADGVGDGRVVHAGVQLPPPTSEASPAPTEPLHRSDGARTADGNHALGDLGNGPANTDQGRLRLDDDTRREGTLNYHSVFNPSIVPFKRGGVLDKVVVTRSGEYLLEVADTRLRPIEVVGDDVQPDRDRFWGSLVIEAKPETAIPIPSVAPGARILSVETHPPVDVRFLVDGADNMFVRMNHQGTVRLNFITDARSEYFAPTVMPDGIRVQDAQRYARPPGLEKGMARDAARDVARAIGIGRRDDFGDALSRLVEYFRDFDPSPLEDSEMTGDLYRDVALSRRGVCRHRAFAFVATAQYLGIHARYVYNEAHAFVEVFVPTRGWARIDLGGGADGLRVHNTDAKILHSPPTDDPFPQPARYLSEYSRVANADDADELPGGFDRVEGLPQHPSEITAESESLSEASDGSPGSSGASESGGAANHELTDGSEVLAMNPLTLGEADEGSDGGVHAERSSQPAPSRANGDAQAGIDVVQERPQSRLVVRGVPSETWRGQTVTVNGQLLSADGDVPLADRTVQIVLTPMPGTAGNRTPLGSTQTDDLGRFTLELEMPQTLGLGQWDLFAYYPGDDTHAPARSE